LTLAVVFRRFKAAGFRSILGVDAGDPDPDPGLREMHWL